MHQCARPMDGVDFTIYIEQSINSNLLINNTNKTKLNETYIDDHSNPKLEHLN